MDTFTHGLLGAAASQVIFAKQLPRTAGLIGLVAAMTPDLDLLVGSGADPVSSLLYHRQFTHSLVFIPVGGLLTALLFLWMKPFRGVWPAVIGAALIGYATHAPLDALTSYGTLLFWPFSMQRIAWDIMPIVEPIFTGTLLAGVVWTSVVQRVRPSQLALAVALAYLGFAAWQHHRAAEVQQQLVTARGQAIEHSRVMPAPGSLVLWRSVYISTGRIYVDGIRVPWWHGARLKAGGSVRLATFADVPPQMAERDGTRRVFHVFAWFADDLIAAVEGEASVIGDIRYAVETSSLVPLWGIQFEAERSAQPMRWRASRHGRGDFIANTWGILIHGDPSYRPLLEVLSASPHHP
jgi:inner membrane protein